MVLDITTKWLCDNNIKQIWLNRYGSGQTNSSLVRCLFSHITHYFIWLFCQFYMYLCFCVSSICLYVVTIKQKSNCLHFLSKTQKENQLTNQKTFLDKANSNWIKQLLLSIHKNKSLSWNTCRIINSWKY